MVPLPRNSGQGTVLHKSLSLNSQARSAVDTDFYNGLLLLLLLIFGFVWVWKGLANRRFRLHSVKQESADAASSAKPVTRKDTAPTSSHTAVCVSESSPTKEKDGNEAGSSVSSFTTADRGATTSSKRAEFASFQRSFLFTYILMATADWLQGAYVYRLYSYYGFSRADNGYLFIAGYGSSLVFGTWAGPIADRYGRKFCCVMYGVSYIIGCWTKFYNDFGILLMGRIVSGIATSILCSGFESWMASEHQSRGFDPQWIGETFSHMCTLNGLAAIASGFLAEYAVAFYNNHPVAPFGLAGVLLAVGTIIIFTQWRENYGDRGSLAGGTHSFLKGIFLLLKGVVLPLISAGRLVVTDPQIRLVGLLQSLYEGCMYTFVFMWSPALEQAARSALSTKLAKDHNWPADATPNPRAEAEVFEVIASALPYGIVFASFMLGSSLGGSLFSSVSSAGDGGSGEGLESLVPDHHGRSVSGPSDLPPTGNRKLNTRQLFILLFTVSSASFAVPVFFSSQVLLMLSFVTFEVCVGLFWPSLGVLRTRYLPEAQRATIINIYRIPLNAIVVCVLMFQGSMRVGTVFAICAVLLAVGALLSTKLK